MAKKSARNAKAGIPRQKPGTAASGGEHELPDPQARPVRKKKPVTENSKLGRNLGIVLFLLAFFLYANTIGSGYALDDYGLILENNQTKAGSDALGQIFSSSYRAGSNMADVDLYRPLSKAMFAIEWSVSPASPGLNHFMNVVLFAFTGLLLFRTLRLYLKGTLVPFLASALFIVHPLHTEVVANIKGRDDILCFLFFIAAANFLFRFHQSGKNRFLVFTGIAYFLSFLSKESAITYLAALPLMLWFFTDADKKTYLRSAAVLAAVAAVFLLIRAAILPDVPSEPPEVDNYIAHLDGFLMQRANAVYILGIYLVKLLVPYPLVCDRSLQDIPVVGAGSWQFLLSLAVYLALTAFAVLRFRSKNPFAFCILYFIVTLSIVSNLPFLIGTNYAERLLYTPSLGFCLAVAFGLEKLMPGEAELSSLSSFFRSKGKVMALLALVALVFSVLTFNRNAEWENNDTLYAADIHKAPGSTKLNYFIAAHITLEKEISKYPAGSPERKKVLDSAYVLLKRSLAIYPGYADAMHKLAQVFADSGKPDSANIYYQKAIKIFPASPLYHNNYGTLLFNQGKPDEARKEFETAVKWNPGYADALNNIANAYGTEAGNLLREAQKDSLDPHRNDALARQKFETSLTYSLKALQYNPDYAPAYITTAITYGNLGNQAEQQKYQALAEQAKLRANR